MENCCILFLQKKETEMYIGTSSLLHCEVVIILPDVAFLLLG